MCGECVVGVQLRVDGDLLQAGYDEGVLDVGRIGASVELRYGRGVGRSRYGHLLLDAGHGVEQPWLLALDLIDYLREELEIVLFYMCDIALVGDFQPEVCPVEFEGYDGCEPLRELLLRGLFLDTVQARLPYVVISSRVDHRHNKKSVLFVIQAEDSSFERDDFNPCGTSWEPLVVKSQRSG